MYSLPIALVELSLQSRIFGMGILVLDFTDTHKDQLLRCCKDTQDVRYLMVATSELVISLGGPAIRVGSLATTRLLLFMVKMKTLL